MATFVIGDVQGCYVTFERLLARAGFGPGDRLWLVGDLVNRGAGSLEVLRRVRSLGARAQVVLGNHDLHLVARHHGVAPRKRRDTLEAVLGARDREALCDWLQRQPFLIAEGEHVLVHAGLLPSWTVADAEREARAVERELAGPGAREFLQLARREPERGVRWSASESGFKRLQAALWVMTRLRTLRADESLCLVFDGAPAEAPPGCRPWFEAPARWWPSTVLFGHWSALGHYMGAHAIGLDTGCVWGRALTALRLDDREVFSEPAAREDLVST
jgi:bis(5'-nucleosyl)-tetraphosphatase (symmetrical)